MTRLFLVSSGLGHVNRGYESFTRECFDALAAHPDLKISLWKGGGASKPGETALWNLPREGRIAKFLGQFTRRGGYFIEQLTFTLSLLPRVSRLKPDVIYFSDGNIGNLLWHWRRVTRGRYKLLFSNGGPLSPPFERWDYVQQVAPTHLKTALSAGEPAKKLGMVPYGIRMEADFRPLSSDVRRQTRIQLNLPVDRPLILSVAAINASQKRMDYLIREVAALSQPRPFLLLLGQQDEETPEVMKLALELLGEGNFVVKTVAFEDVKDYYQISDVFVLASLSEGFGRVFLEAASQGLVCLAHDYDLTHYVLGEYGEFADFTQTMSLTTLLKKNFDNSENESRRQARHQDIYQRFSWNALQAAYVEMIRKVADKEPGNGAVRANLE